MNEELIITNEDIELLKEMKNNCLKADVYNDEKRLLKANAITKFLMLEQENKEQEEYITYWQKETDKRQDKIDKVEKWLKYKAEALDKFDIPKRKETGAFWFATRGEIDGLLEILKDSDVDV